MKKITCDADTGARIDMATVGPDWLGFIYFRIYATPSAWMTFYGLKLLWFTFTVNVPAMIGVRLLGEDRERGPWL